MNCERYDVPFVKELDDIQGRLLSRMNSSSDEDCSELVVEFESLVRSLIVAMNQEYNGLSLNSKIDFTSEVNYLDDTLKIGQGKRGDGRLLVMFDELIRFSNWIVEFKRQLQRDVVQSYMGAMDQRELQRDEAIESHVQQEQEQEQPDRYERVQFDHGTTSTKDKLLKTTRRVTHNLVRGNQILQSGLLQSDLNLDELKQQTHSLQQADDKYSQLETVFRKTNSLVKTLERSSHREKRDVYAALLFLACCVGWVLWRRVFRLPVRLTLWLLFRFFRGTLSAAGVVKSISSSTSSTVATVAAATITAITSDDRAVEIAVDEALSRLVAHDEL
ncbi:hypothetical protein NCAS_0I02530 [Naumovozyma castellii]|uniref:Sec20 C-terminal domain-containing protein n=1 Tax=Naumovozyma castellii TaxID=27288 RepID=G0VK87_NAUCA|nr:hypothetical protein NCAS_0I02530 [Naumovozyma castellii CBS 4309]CCC71921.1 hypothetical protein NCAS_0I02530 [Naumovozyma castellii CBS 4309]